MRRSFVTPDEVYVALVALLCADLGPAVSARAVLLVQAFLEWALPSPVVENCVEAALYAVGRPDLVCVLYRGVYGALIGAPFCPCGVDDVLRRLASGWV